MIPNLTKAASGINIKALLNPLPSIHQQLRTTYILKRKIAPPLHKAGQSPKRLQSKHFIYELVKETSIERKPDLNLILTQYVEGLGNAGEKVSVRPTYGYNKLLLPGLAVYASPENVEKYKDYVSEEGQIKHSSPFAEKTVKHLSKMLLSVVMNRDNPWTLQPWHVRTSFRKCGYTVPEEAITMPSRPVQGPDMNLQEKEFYVTVSINNFETVKVRCRIHHWSTQITERIPHVHNFWAETAGCLFPEEADVLESMPKKVVKEQNQKT